MDIINRYKHNEFFSADSIRFADSLKFTTPKGKIVYGGGGIMPDIFIPLDTTNMTKYFMEVTGRNILYRYTIDYADKHRAALNGVQTIEELQALLDADKGLVQDFVRYASRHGVRPVQRDIARSRKLIEAQLRAYIGRNTPLEDNGFYYNIIPIDNVLLESISMFEKEESDKK
jgi:carboxyl-terminal processing protease